jgi:hypothetical protein
MKKNSKVNQKRQKKLEQELAAESKKKEIVSDLTDRMVIT